MANQPKGLMMQSLKFDANLQWLFTELPFEQRFDAAARAGFAAVEYADPYHHTPERLRRWLAASGLRQVLINTPMGPKGSAGERGYACLPDEVATFRDGVLRALDYATALGAPLVHVVGGIVPGGASLQQGFAQYVANIAWAAEQVQGTNVRLVLEVQNKRDAPRFVLADQAQAAAVARAVNSDRVGLLMDFYHLQIDEGDLIETYRRHQPIVWHLQVADVPARNEPGTGEINYPNLFAAVALSGYDGWIGCEYRPATDTSSGLAWLSGLGN